MESPSHHILDMLDWREIWLAKEVFDKLNGSKTVLRISTTYRFAVSVPLMTTKEVKRNGTPDHNFCLRGCLVYNSESTLSWASPDHVFDDRQDTDGFGVRR
ncbi:hypothetical protein TNCV_3805701 [Trichonephila clavipes]|nr:hypothetical protein TNCV_3805701 [Trichonephila clavipes]